MKGKNEKKIKKKYTQKKVSVLRGGGYGKEKNGKTFKMKKKKKWEKCIDVCEKYIIKKGCNWEGR